MAQLIDITRVEVGERNLEATVRVMPGAPLMTSEDIEATALVYNVMPHIAEHACTGDAGSQFKDAMGNTELAHLLEHVAVELMARAGSDGQIVCGRTRSVADDPRSFVIQLACPDDVLAIAALSSAAWVIDWAFTGGDGPVPDVDAIAGGIARLAAEAPVADDEPVAAEDTSEEPAADEPQEPADVEPQSEPVAEEPADEALVDKSQEAEEPVEEASADEQSAGDIASETSASEEDSNG